MPITVTPSFDGTLYSRKPFSYGFSTSFFQFDSSFQFTDSAAGILPATSVASNTFASTTGYTGSGSLGNLIADVVSANPTAVANYPTTALSTVDPNNMCFDPSGNLYFVTSATRVVQKVDTSGLQTTIAGSGSAATVDGVGTAASFFDPRGIAIDTSGTLYVTDRTCIRQITPDGTVTTIAGTTDVNYTEIMDGPKFFARFSTPRGMTIDPSRNLYIAEANTIRKLTPDGIVTTLAGTGSGTSTNGTGGTFSNTSNAFVVTGETADEGFFVAYSTNGTTWTVDTSSGVPNLPKGQSIAWNGSNQWLVGGNGAGCKLAISQTGRTYTGTSTIPADMLTIYGLAWNGSMWVAAVSDNVSSNTLRYSYDGVTWSNCPTQPFSNTPLSVAWGNNQWVAGGSNETTPIAYSSDGLSWTVGSFTGTAPVSIKSAVWCSSMSLWAAGGQATVSGETLFSSSDGISWTAVSNQIDSNINSLAYLLSLNRVYATGESVANVSNVLYSSNLSTFTYGAYTQIGVGIAAVPGSNLVVVASSNLLHKFSTAFTSPASNAVPLGGIAKGITSGTLLTRTGATLGTIGTIAIDSSRNLLFTDSNADTIRKLTVDTSTVSTFAGTGSIGQTDGSASIARFWNPYGIAIDSSDTVYIGDAQNFTVRKIQNGVVSTIAGIPRVRSPPDSWTNGAVGVATCYRPAAVATFSNFVVFGDRNPPRLRAIYPPAPEVRPSGSRPAGFTIVESTTIPVTVLSRIDASTTAIGGVIQLYKYEPFSEVFTLRSAVTPPDTLRYSNSTSSLLGFCTNPSSDTVVFTSSNGFQNVLSNATLLIEDMCGSTVTESLQYTVNVGLGRFFPPAANSAFVFYKNEPITPQEFRAVLPIQPPVSNPSLPAGLSFVRTSSNSFNLVGTPTVVALASNYRVYSKGSVETAKTVIVDFTLRVDNERMALDVSGASTFTNLVDGTPITPTTVTARVPPYGTSSAIMRYSWNPPLLPGFAFRNINGIEFTNSNAAFPLDSSYTIVLDGTSTNSASLIVAGTGGRTWTTTLTGTRLSPTPTLTASNAFVFEFAEDVLFPSSNFPSVYANVPIPSNSIFLEAKTYFATIDSSIASMEIIEGDVPDGLTFTFASNASRGYFNGTPSTAGSNAFIIRATNSNGVFSDANVSLPIVNDTITFDYGVTPLIDTCSTFIQYRPVTSAKSGYYTSAILFKASAASGCNVSMAISGVNGTGLALTNVSANTYQLTGTPVISKSLSTATVEATSATVPIPVTTTIKYSIASEVFTFNDVSIDITQNLAISPVQVIATTLSERPIIAYTSTSVPQGLTLSSAGILSGILIADTSGTMIVSASTGYTSASKAYAYNVTRDSMLLTVPSSVYTLTVGESIPPVQVTGISYSGTAASNFLLGSLTPTYGFTIGSNSGLIGGTFSSGLPPDPLLPSSCNFFVQASVGLLDASLASQFTVTNQPVNRSLLAISLQASNSGDPLETRVYSSDASYTQWATVNDAVFDISGGTMGLELKYTSSSNYTILALVGNTVGRSTTTAGDPVYSIATVSATGYSHALSALVNRPGTSTWWAAGLSSTTPVMVTSTDDGVTWDGSPGSIITGLVSRDSNSAISVTNTYLKGGIALAYLSNGGLFSGLYAGGIDPTSKLPLYEGDSTGTNWNQVSGIDLTEIADINTQDSNIMVVAGSSDYTTVDYDTFTWSVAAKTIRYTVLDSNGRPGTWSNVTGGPNMSAYFLSYGNSTWVVTGFSSYDSGSTYEVELHYSTNGSNWTKADLSATNLFGTFVTPPAGTSNMIPIGRPIFDGNTWNVAIRRDTGDIEIYSHDTLSPLSNGWVEILGSNKGDLSTLSSAYNVQLTDMTPARFFTRSPTSAFLTFPSQLGSGPTITSPVETTYILNQYVPIEPIDLAATGTGFIYFFIDQATLPAGLRFNPITGKITGSPSQIGETSVLVYARDDNGLSRITLTFSIIRPRVVRQQTSAGAWTSLVRQYTLVNAAQNARDNRVLAEDRQLGEFMAGPAPDVVTQSNGFRTPWPY